MLVTVRGATAAPQGALAGRPLHFFRAAGGLYQALAPLPTEVEPGPAPLTVTDGGAPVPASLAIAPANFRSSTLDVPPRFLEPPAWAKARIARDQAALGKAYAQPFGPPAFVATFALPRDAERTGRYGDQRVYNGKTSGVHYGLDLSAPAGAPVAASNDGVVVLARDCYMSGNTVILWHGAGVYTAYLHLSRMLVKPGAKVRRGQRIGLVGSTGRSTGPHLHWGAKVDGLWVDPESLMRLDLAASLAGPPAAAAPPAPAAP